MQRGWFVEDDIADSAKVTETCRSYGVVAAIHFAAAVIVEESVVELAKYYRNNVTGIVFSSSCVVYGAPKDVIFSRRNLTP